MLLCIHLVVFFTFDWTDQVTSTCDKAAKFYIVVVCWSLLSVDCCCCWLSTVFNPLDGVHTLTPSWVCFDCGCCLIVVVGWSLLLVDCGCLLIVVVGWSLLLADCCCLLIVVVGWSLLLVDVDHCCLLTVFKGPDDVHTPTLPTDWTLNHNAMCKDATSEI